MNILEDDWSLSHWKGATDKEHNITNLPTKIITSNGAIIAELRWDNLKNVTALDAYKIGKLMVKANKMLQYIQAEKAWYDNGSFIANGRDYTKGVHDAEADDFLQRWRDHITENI